MFRAARSSGRSYEAAAISIRADGVIVEVHTNREIALSDRERQLTFKGFAEPMENIKSPLRTFAVNKELALCI